MTANELRIGNLVSIGGAFTYADPVDILVLSQDKLFFDGVPLTEEWLLKFGFTGKIHEISKCGNFYLGYDPEYHMHKMSLWYQDGSWCFNHTNKFTVLKYVHQLQNLYFALTGEELLVCAE